MCVFVCACVYMYACVCVYMYVCVRVVLVLGDRGVRMYVDGDVARGEGM